MLDIPKLGRSLLNGALAHIAITADSEELEAVDAIIENCKALIEDTPLKRGLMATSKGSHDLVAREREVVRSLMEICEVRGMTR